MEILGYFKEYIEYLLKCKVITKEEYNVLIGINQVSIGRQSGKLSIFGKVYMGFINWVCHYKYKCKREDLESLRFKFNFIKKNFDFVDDDMLSQVLDICDNNLKRSIDVIGTLVYYIETKENIIRHIKLCKDVAVYSGGNNGSIKVYI